MPDFALPGFSEEPVMYEEFCSYDEIKLEGLNTPVAHLEDHIVVQSADTVKVYDRSCDHNNGRLITGADGQVRCPLHGWEFDPESGQYKNVNCIKTPLVEFSLTEKNSTLSVPRAQTRRVLPEFGSDKAVKIRYFNHASVIVECENLKIGLDPWLLGPAFCRGWWLAQPSPSDAISEFNSCDLIYISHNHPDHLHEETLRHIRKDLPILTAAFESGSSIARLKQLGFANVLAADFGSQFVNDAEECTLSVLKSGDFRDDSGLLIQSGTFSALFTVDSNFLDFFRFPNNLTLLATSFASGASGYPLCFENLTEKQMSFVIARNRNAVKHINQKMLKLTNASHYMPYAGMFKERASRDKKIAERNVKNSTTDFLPICEEIGSTLLDVSDVDTFDFLGTVLQDTRNSCSERLVPEDPDALIEETKQKLQKLANEDIKTYFENSCFHGDLILAIQTTDDNFKSTEDEVVLVEFDSLKKPKVSFVDQRYSAEELHKSLKKNAIVMRVRADAFYEVLADHLPWEDFSIGFQMRLDREPNHYNSTFWHHFTNIYTKSAFSRATTECTACELLIQSIELIAND